MRPLLTILVAGCADTSLTVNNSPPEVTITAPAGGSGLAEGQTITLAAIVDDAQTPVADLTFSVTSTLDGALATTSERTDTGILFQLAGLSAGDQQITVTAADASGATGEDTVRFAVVANVAPTVAFAEPLAGQTEMVGSAVHVQIAVADANDENVNAFGLVWGGEASALAGLPTAPNSDGSADFYLTDLAIGAYSVSVTVSDSFGATSSASVAFEVAEPDEDGDGYVGESLGGPDCNDGDASVNPGAAEWCNGIDDNCDGEVDELGSLGGGTWYADTDGDGYGDGSTEIAGCTDPAGYVEDDRDCDDTDAGTSPVGVELCLDGADNDCDGTVDNCTLDGADARFIGATRGDLAGYLVSSLGDTDGDGTDDLVVTAASSDAGATNMGAMYLLRGAQSGDVDLGAVTDVILGGAPIPVGQYNINGGVDLTGDGVLDFVVSGNDNNVHVFPGDLTGTVDYDEATEVELEGFQWTNGIVARSDALFVADWMARQPRGAVYVFETPLTDGARPADADALIVGDRDNAAFGYSLADVGDVDGDGNDDLLAGARLHDEAGSMAGAAYLLSGPFAGEMDAADATAKWTGEATGDYAGYAVAAAGDTDGDGYADLVVGAYSESTVAEGAGAAYVILGGSAPSGGSVAVADAKLLGEGPDHNAGDAVAGAGDVDDDGLADLLVGAYRYSGDLDSNGRVYLLLGPVLGTRDLADADARFDGAEAYDYAGRSLAGGFDNDGDGFPDLFVGAAYADAGLGNSGAAYVVRGGRI